MDHLPRGLESVPDFPGGVRAECNGVDELAVCHQLVKPGPDGIRVAQNFLLRVAGQPGRHDVPKGGVKDAPSLPWSDVLPESMLAEERVVVLKAAAKLG